MSKKDNYSPTKTMNPEEYSAIKAEINGLEAIINTYIIAMVTVAATIIGWGLDKQNSWLYLLAYMIIFSFQRVIDQKRRQSVKLSSFLAVYANDTMKKFIGSNYQTGRGGLCDRPNQTIGMG